MAILSYMLYRYIYISLSASLCMCANGQKCFYWSFYVDIQFAHYGIRPISRSPSHYSFSRFSVIQCRTFLLLLPPSLPLHCGCYCCCCFFGVETQQSNTVAESYIFTHTHSQADIFYSYSCSS